MKYSILILIFVFASLRGIAQDHTVAYTTIELIMNYMPETKQVEKELADYKQQLREELEVIAHEGKAIITQYQNAEKNGASEDELKALMTKYQELDERQQIGFQKAESKLTKKQGDLMKPMMAKLQKAIDEVATEGGYTYVINNAIGDGVPSLLFGQDALDITERIAKKLGIVIPN
jgi:outer membrane protein